MRILEHACYRALGANVDELFLDLLVRRGLAAPALVQGCRQEHARAGGSLPRLVTLRAGLAEHQARQLYQEAQQQALQPNSNLSQSSQGYAADLAGYVSDTSFGTSPGGPAVAPPLAGAPGSGYGQTPGSGSGSGSSVTPWAGQQSSFGRSSGFTAQPSGGTQSAFTPAGLRPGMHFNRYRLEEELGRGAMGIVWRARQLDLERDVALKMLLQGTLATEELRRRFVNEAKAVARLVHPNVVTIHDVGEQDGILFFTMDFVNGPSLGQLLKREKVSLTRALEITGGIAEGLDHAHGQGIIHRDLKPANVLIDKRGTSRITDFGIAKDTTRQSSTIAGQVLGTPGYMSPEQADGGKKIDARTDVYAVGAILFRCLTGRPPFTGDGAYDLINRVLSEPPPKPRSLDSSIPPEVEELILECLAKDPGKRPASAAELAKRLRKLHRRHEPPASSALHPRARSFSTQTAVIAGVGVLLLGLGLGLGIHGWKSLQRANALAEQRETERQEAEAAAREAEREKVRKQALARLAEARGLAERDPAAARAILSEVVTGIPEDAGARLLYARLLREAKDHEGALAQADAALQAAPGELAALSERGRCLYALERESEAEEVASQLEAKGKEGERAAAELRCEGALVRGEIPVAVVHLDQAVRAAPEDPALRLRMTGLLVQAGRYTSAVEEARHAIRLNPDSAEPLALRAQARFEIGDYPKALADAQEALAKDPDHAEARRVKQAAQAKLPREEPTPGPGAGPSPPAAGEGQPHDEQHRALRACLAALQRGDVERAKQALRMQLQEVPLRCPSGLWLRQQCFLRLGDVRNAIKDLYTLLRLQGPNPQLMKTLGMAHTRVKNGEEVLQQLISKQPQQAGYHFALAEYHVARKDYAAALAGYDKTLEVDPDYVEAYHERCHLHHGQRELEKALQDADACISRKVTPHFLMMRGDVLADLGRVEEARKSYEQVLGSPNEREKRAAQAKLEMLKSP